MKNAQKTCIYHNPYNVINTVIEFVDKTNDRIDACFDYTRPYLDVDIIASKKAFIEAKERGVELRYVTEITYDNVNYCKGLINTINVDELRHLNEIKDNFYVSKKEYMAPATFHHEGKPASHSICIIVKEIVGHQQKEKFKLNDLISSVAEDCRRQIDNSSVRLICKFEEKRGEDNNNDAAIFVDADKSRLTQIISNLLSNAIKFTKEGTVCLDVEKRVGEKEQGTKKEVVAVITVRDTGKGIDSQLLYRLFSKSVTKYNEEAGGTGLGPFISKCIVEAHDGTIMPKITWIEKVQLLALHYQLLDMLNWVGNYSEDEEN